MENKNPTSQDVLDFWFKEIDRRLWFQKSTDFDQLLRSKFLSLHTEIQNGQTARWRANPEGRLAEVIVLDQFSRNMFRDTPQSFASDSLALSLAKEAIAVGADQGLPVQQRGFLYMPFMHSESAADHIKAVELFSQPGLEYNLEFEIKHKKIIDRFGRYPHRNKILGRASTEDEIKFLKEPGSSF